MTPWNDWVVPTWPNLEAGSIKANKVASDSGETPWLSFGVDMKIISIKNSFWFYNCSVVETECGHKHVRPNMLIKHLKVGDNFICYCESEEK